MIPMLRATCLALMCIAASACGSESPTPLPNTDAAPGPDGAAVDAPVVEVEAPPLGDGAVTPLPDADNLCGDGCGEAGSSTGCAAPVANADAAAPGCADGEVWVTSFMAHFNAFCAKPCKITPDCPSGMLCVSRDITADYAGAVCVSDGVPLPRCGAKGDTLRGSTSGTLEGPGLICSDAQTMGTKYENPRTGISGWELTPCPNGCQGGGPDGGIWGLTPGGCR